MARIKTAVYKVVCGYCHMWYEQEGPATKCGHCGSTNITNEKRRYRGAGLVPAPKILYHGY